MKKYCGTHLSLSFFLVASTLEQRASVKRFVPLQFLHPKTVGRTPWMTDQPVARPPPNINTERRQTSMPWVGFELTILLFERAKTVHALDCMATVIIVGDMECVKYQKWSSRMLAAFNCLRIESNHGLLWTRQWTFWLHSSSELLGQLTNYQLFREDHSCGVSSL
jgi:hypothetical protein